jgi:hypothetical protein
MYLTVTNPVKIGMRLIRTPEKFSVVMPPDAFAMTTPVPPSEQTPGE